MTETPNVLDRVAAAAGASNDGTGALRILAIDDDPAVLDVLSRMLCAEGYEVHITEDGRRGLELDRPRSRWML